MADVRQPVAEPYISADQVNREIAQDAHTDGDLESIVPPVSRNGTVWRIAAVVVLLLALLTAILWAV
ncbi:hypothetical protein FMN50_04845 [Rhodobacterales bacterium]|nr:hypothetical protein FMN50_04845 [Rhodobacterales bacterium]